MEKTPSSPPPAPDRAAQRAAAEAHAARAWTEFWAAIRSITPSGLVRFAIWMAAISLIGFVLVRSWAALLPFQMGVVLAYLLLPFVNRLARHMPRWAAILITFTVGGLVVGSGFTLLLPPVFNQINSIIDALPTQVDLEELLGQLQTYYQTLPLSTQNFIDSSINEALAWLQTNLAEYVRTTFTFLFTTVFSLVNTATFLFGFLIVPFWLFFVLNDVALGVKAFDRIMPAWIRADTWAFLRIIDRIFSKYIRGQLILGLIVGLAAFFGLSTLKAVGVGGIEYELVLAVIAGITELVPLIGPILGAIPAVIIAFTDSWQSGLIVLALYIGIQQLENNFLVPRIQGESIEIHPAILSTALVALSQFGFLWLVLAAPLVAIVRDLFIYAYGRFAEPPKPAGLIPGDPLPEATSQASEANANAVAPQASPSPAAPAE